MPHPNVGVNRDRYYRLEGLSAILGYFSTSTAAPEPVKGGTRFESCTLKSHFTLTALGAVCNHVVLLTWTHQRGCVDEAGCKCCHTRYRRERIV